MTVVLSAAPRIALAVGALPAGVRPFIWSDVLATYLERLSGGRIPYFEAFFEYPPLIGYAAGLLVRVADGPVIYVALWSALTAAAAAVVALLLTRMAGAPMAIRYWSLSPQLLLFGAMNWDVIAALFAVAALILSRKGARLGALAVMGAGALVKAFPAALAPLEVERTRRERGPTAAGAAAAVFALTVVALAVPSLVAPYSSLDGARYVAGLVNFDSLFGVIQGTLEGLGVQGAATALAWVSVIGTLGTYAIALRRVRPEADPARVGLAGVLAVLLWSRLYSPQYSIWVIPFFALARIPARTFALLSLADVIVFATVYPLTLVQWDPASATRDSLFALLVVGIVLRHVALIWTFRSTLAT